MKKGMITLIISVTLIFVVSFSFMNYNYDNLSRYPYKDEESRKIIKKYLSDDEIDYIIEYSIAPSLFINFIKEDGFNIYHAEEYYRLSQIRWQDSSSDIVKMVENTRNIMDINSLAAYLDHYSYDELEYWINNGDKYKPESTLVVNAGDLRAYVDDNNTISIRTPFNLQVIDKSIPVIDEGIMVDVAVQEPLKNMCKAIEEELESNKKCGGLKVESGYISYEQQEALYKVAQTIYKDKADIYEFYPGHSESQLGLAVDFVVDDVEAGEFNRTVQSTCLENKWQKSSTQSLSVCRG